MIKDVILVKPRIGGEFSQYVEKKKQASNQNAHLLSFCHALHEHIFWQLDDTRVILIFKYWQKQESTKKCVWPHLVVPSVSL